MRYNLDDITANITDWITMYKRAGTDPFELFCPDKAETGHYTIKLSNGSGSTSWHLDRSVHRNRVIRRLGQEFPELLPMCRNQRLNEIGI